VRSLGVAGPWITCMIYGIILGLFCLLRFRRGAWQSAVEQPSLANSNVSNDSTKLSALTEPTP